MRRCILILMIALLPLRVWAGGAMVVGMAAQQLVANANGFIAAAAPQSDCAVHSHAAAAAVNDQEEAQGAPADAQCSTCTSCQVCSSTALLVQTGAHAGNALSHSVPVIVGAAFTSAAPAPGLKPPIS